MKTLLGILKAIALSLLSLLLVISLFVLGIAISVDRTALSSRFVSSEIKKIEGAAIVQALMEQDESGEISPELEAALADAIGSLEPVIEKGLADIINPAYRYLRGKDDTFDAARVLQESVLNPDYLVSVLDAVDLAALLNEVDETALLREIAGDEAFNEMPEDTLYVLPYAGVVISDLKPWLKKQLPVVAGPVIEYLLGQRDSFKVEISLESPRIQIQESLQKAFFASPPPALAAMPRPELEQYYLQHYYKLTDGIPSSFSIDESAFGSDVRAEISEALASAADGLGQARRYVSYFQTGFWLLTGLVALLVILIALIYHRVKPASRHLGILFLSLAVPEIIGVLVGKSFLRNQLLQQEELPAQLKAVIQTLAADALLPFIYFLTGLVILGLALLALSFLYKRRAAIAPPVASPLETAPATEPEPPPMAAQ
jgi:hypothetical protein